jgi:5-methylcytosine-specific restriction endonuclease McrA
LPCKDPIARQEYKKRYQEENRERILERKRRYREANREALRLKAKERYQEKREEILAKDRKHRQENLEERRVEARQYYAKNRERIRFLASKGKARIQAYNRIYRAQHRERLRELFRQWYAKNIEGIRAREKLYKATRRSQFVAYAVKRRAQQLNAPRNDLTADQWEAIKAAYGYRCIYCERPMQRLTQDHLTPLSKGGSHTLHNVVPACQSCNSRKRNGKAPKLVQPLLL